MPDEGVAQIPSPSEMSSNPLSEEYAGKGEADTNHPVPKVKWQGTWGLKWSISRHMFPIFVLNNVPMIRLQEATACPRQMEYAPRHILWGWDQYVPPVWQDPGLGIKERIQNVLVGIFRAAIFRNEIPASGEHVSFPPSFQIDDAHPAAAIISWPEAF